MTYLVGLLGRVKTPDNIRAIERGRAKQPLCQLRDWPSSTYQAPRIV